MAFDVIIPARYASTRLPGKPLVKLGGKTLIERVFNAAQRSAAERIIVATDDRRIADVAQSFGADVCMTRQDHASGTDRLAEVVSQLNMDDQRIVVNLQGDEPFAPASLINCVATTLQRRPAAVMATACHRIDQPAAIADPNRVKVVFDHEGYALYFSRSPIPYRRNTTSDTTVYFQHIGIYAYRAEFIGRYHQLPASLLEQAESLEQLRVLASGHRIAIDEFSGDVGFGIDTPADVQRANDYIESTSDHGMD